MDLETWRHRLSRGPRWRRAEFVLRGGGVIILSLIWPLSLIERHQELLNRPSSIVPFGIALAIVLTLWIGLTLLVAGQDLFRPQPRPPRAWLPDKRSRRS